MLDLCDANEIDQRQTHKDGKQTLNEHNECERKHTEDEYIGGQVIAHKSFISRSTTVRIIRPNRVFITGAEFTLTEFVHCRRKGIIRHGSVGAVCASHGRRCNTRRNSMRASGRSDRRRCMTRRPRGATALDRRASARRQTRRLTSRCLTDGARGRCNTGRRSIKASRCDTGRCAFGASGRCDTWWRMIAIRAQGVSITGTAVYRLDD